MGFTLHYSFSPFFSLNILRQGLPNLPSWPIQSGTEHTILLALASYRVDIMNIQHYSSLLLLKGEWVSFIFSVIIDKGEFNPTILYLLLHISLSFPIPSVCFSAKCFSVVLFYPLVFESYTFIFKWFSQGPSKFNFSQKTTLKFKSVFNEQVVLSILTCTSPIQAC